MPRVRSPRFPAQFPTGTVGAPEKVKAAQCGFHFACNPGTRGKPGVSPRTAPEAAARPARAEMEEAA